MEALRTEKPIEIARPSRGLDAETSAPHVGSGRSVFLDIPSPETSSDLCQCDSEA